MALISQYYVKMWSDFVLPLFFFLLREIRTKTPESNINNVDVIRLIDITTFIVKSQYKITFQNLGPNAVQKYEFEVQDGEAFVTVADSNNQTLSYDVRNEPTSTLYIINLNKSLAPKEACKLKIMLIYPSKLTPTTKFSRYNEDHSFVWKGNSHFYSRYYTITYRYMFVTHPSFNKNIETSIKYDSSVENMFVYYGQNIKPYSYEPIVLTFSSPLPVFRVKKLDRTIYVSQFGKIIIEDQVVVENAGPKLLGPYHNNQNSYWMYTHLPSSAENIKFYDVIGNNSKTFLHENDEGKTIKFIPRYSLLQGGWKSTYTLQYCVPIYDYVFRDETIYYLKIRALDHILNDVAVEDVEVKIVLPDGASIVTVFVPAGFRKGNNSNAYTSLSIIGRETVNLKGKMMVETHIDDVIIKYHYSIFNFLIAPFFIMLLLECVFFFIIMWGKYSQCFCL